MSINTGIAACTTAALLALGATACGGNTTTNTTKPTAGSTATPTPTTAPIAPLHLPTAPALTHAKGARKDVTLGTCATSKGKQTVGGRVINSSKATRDYLITVNWVGKNSEVRGRGIAVVKAVPAGKSRRWHLSAQVASGARQCVLNVKRGSLK